MSTSTSVAACDPGLDLDRTITSGSVLGVSQISNANANAGSIGLDLV